MAEHMQVALEIGPKGKKVVAVAPDWPGLERGAKTRDAAVAALLSYVPRYARVAELAGLCAVFASASGAEVVEEYAGTGSTDFWGISFAFSRFDHELLSTEALERELALMRAGWLFFDEVRGRVSAEMQKGPRGGGKDRDGIVRHTLAAELDWAKGLKLPGELEPLLTADGLTAHREAYVEAIRAHHAEGKGARTWPLRYLIRHTAYHAINHAWEMEDKDLTGKEV